MGLLLFASCLSLSAQVPFLQGKGIKTRMMVEGKPYLMLSGELHNSTSSSLDYMRENKVMERMKNMNLNTVIASVSWEQMEPVEGVYDFTLVDGLLEEARKQDLHLMLIWFGTFKNPFMTYAPSWVKKDPKRFPRAVDDSGEELEMLSMFSPNVRQADLKAYKALLAHLRDTDKSHVVLMMQIGNEPGLRIASRDRSALADKAFFGQVPEALTSYLSKNAKNLKPDIARVWNAQGKRIKGTWEEVFGKSVTEPGSDNQIVNFTEHIFTAWSYADYIEEFAREGKKVYALPTFVNSSVFGMNSRARSLGNGCSVPELLDVYMAAAPSLDVLTPNSYMQQLDWLCDEYQYRDNAVLIPESTLQVSRALYAYGAHSALAFSPFGIDLYQDEQTESALKQAELLSKAYGELQEMGSLLLDNLGTDRLGGVYLYSGHETDTLEMGDYELIFSRRKGFDIGALMAPATGQTQAASTPADNGQGGVLILQAERDKFYFIGTGFNVSIKLKDGIRHRFMNTDEIYEGHFKDGAFIKGRLLNGDERNIYASRDTLGVFCVSLYHY